MEKIEANLKAVCKSMKKDRDYTLAITGKKRRGKSTLAYWISEYVSKQMKSKVWLCYSYEDLRKAMEKSKQYDVIFADEAISFLNKYQWNSPDAMEFITLYDMMGYKNTFIILVMPSFKQFVKGFRTDRLDAHIWIPARGMAAVYPVEESKDGCYFPSEPAISDSFPQLPPERETEYRKIKEDAVRKELEKGGVKIPRSIADFRKSVNEKLKEKFPDMTQEERSEFIGVTTQRVGQIDARIDLEAGKELKTESPLPSI